MGERALLAPVRRDVFVGRGTSLPAVYTRLASSFVHEEGASSALAEMTSVVEQTLLFDIGSALAPAWISTQISRVGCRDRTTTTGL